MPAMIALSYNPSDKPSEAQVVKSVALVTELDFLMGGPNLSM